MISYFTHQFSRLSISAELEVLMFYYIVLYLWTISDNYISGAITGLCRDSRGNATYAW
jgi:hypothetical protein